ncbi:MAG: hypothetical protein A3B37_03775 [Candidatus Sungbacteria bacterium RIFCSPLOWO2_01_FULL_59_16]|uniref:DUF4145 domain-containing protein n=1 Tax=Candidatus Sungbacteria bacterium RIFCSPLOWO2_01_FULL_59_16 TaxID=1802280 RepID=A0A1G2L922_9BACT|nr:MAG: hypothetical protein A3B37_03775 [Candidatus Sungbacteria bacterium RIFCSPLOWO2_01_FULL_59_16]
MTVTPADIDAFFAFLYEGRIGAITFWWRIIAGILVSAMFAALVVVMMKLNAIQRRKPDGRETAARAGGRPLPSEDLVAKPWQEVMQKMEAANPSDWNLAVIRADSLFDGVLKDMGLSGETMGDRLKQLDLSKLASLNEVWEAHKIRNRIAHATDRALTHDEAARAVGSFEAGLRELQYLTD